MGTVHGKVGADAHPPTTAKRPELTLALPKLLLRCLRGQPPPVVPPFWVREDLVVPVEGVRKGGYAYATGYVKPVDDTGRVWCAAGLGSGERGV